MANENRDIEEILMFGGVDSDTALPFFKKGNFLYALNIINNSSGEGSKGVIKFMKGNLEIPFALPAGENKCIGVAEDHENKKFYFFNWNSNTNHGIYQFDGLTKKVTQVLLNLTDTGNVDILNFSKEYLILHADIARNNLLYWVDGLNVARKTNIDKLLDKSATGYGPTILQSFVNAYKKTANYAPTVAYFSDTTKPFNRIYGALRRFAVRFVYDDGEKSNWSDFSAIALPDKEPFTGIKTIPTNNNGLKISMETGDLTVVKIEVAMQSTSGEVNNDGILNWKLIATLNKDQLNISDNSTYTYSFYNDSVYPVTLYEKIIRPYIFLPKQPRCQSIAKNKLVYSAAKEGFDFVPIAITASVSYNDLFIEDGTVNAFNNPLFTIVGINGSEDFFKVGGQWTNVDGTKGIAKSSKRAIAYTVTVGNDVKLGNKFYINIYNAGQNFSYNVTATGSDTAASIANKIASLLVSSGVIVRKTPDNPDYYIYTTTTDLGGNVSFKFITLATYKDGYFIGATGVDRVQFNTLKDTGESKRNIKLGSTTKYGVHYEDEEGLRKSLVYTDDSLIVGIKTINELYNVDGKTSFQTPVVTLEINHRPPVWAKCYQIDRSEDLVYANYIQMLIQQVINVPSTTTDDYLDLVVGSLVTYNKIHPNSDLGYEFKSGDRIRLIKKTSNDTFYDFFETEILEYKAVTTEKISSNIVSNGSTTVTVDKADASNIGRYIVVEGSERLITGRPTATTYLIDAALGDATSKSYLYYELVDRRGVIKIRKPSFTIEDQSIVEIFTPAQKSNNDKQFFEFQKKFPIINAGTENAYHGGNFQNQDDVLPAIVKIDEGTAYVRNRELPSTNSFPGAQVIISPIEDPKFSDFYPSLINDNGRPNVEDIGVGEVFYENRMRFSNNSIDETKINGLNDFDNLDREDYNDRFGGIWRTVFDDNNIYVWKSLRTGYVPVESILTKDNAGTILRVGSSNFLNPMQFFARKTGIGNHPEAYCANDTHKYFISIDSGSIIRLGRDGEEPISKTFNLDKFVRQALAKASKYGAKIHIGFNTKLALLVVTIEGYLESIINGGFNGWVTTRPTFDSDTEIEVLTGPTNGTVTIDDKNQFNYTPNADYLGDDSFTYRALINGVWTPSRKICLAGKDLSDSEKGWRVKGAGTCELQSGYNTGYREWDVIEEFNIFTSVATGIEKPNVPSDSDYISPTYDIDNCQLSKAWRPKESSAFCVQGTAPTSWRVKSSTAFCLQTTQPVGWRAKQSSSYCVQTGTPTPGQTPCGNQASYGGGESYPTEVVVQLGSSVGGEVVLEYEALAIPDKFVIIFDGVEVVNTGYRGSSQYQSDIDAALAARGLPPETIQGLGQGTASFTKNSNTETAIVRVYAPASGTGWSFILNCPV